MDSTRWRSCHTRYVRPSRVAAAPLIIALVCLFIAARCEGQAPAEVPAAVKACQQTVAAAENLRKQGKLTEAIALCEQFFTQNPQCGAAGRPAVYFVDLVFWKDLGPTVAKDPEAIRRIAARGCEQFANVPDYYALCARYLVQSYLWNDAPKALALAADAVKHLGDQLPDDYVGASLLLFHVYSLRNCNQHRESIALARQYAARAPLLLANLDFLTPVMDSMKALNKPEETLGLAKLIYAVCDFNEEALGKATTWATQALTAAEGPGAGIQFARSQEDPKVANPLKDAPAFALGESGESRSDRDDAIGKKMLQAAGDDPEAKFNALLYLAAQPNGSARLLEAVKFEKERMRSAADAGSLSIALKNLARCFKARDLNLARANAFLQYHRTGEGDNPLKQLEAELEKESIPQPQGKEGKE